MASVIWENAPDAHDYPAASQYLSLLVAEPTLRAELVAQLQAAPVAHYKAKDLLRASQLAVLTADNAHVVADLRKIRKGRPLSPVLLVRGDLLRGFPLQIADGYHRVCASYYTDENTDIPCRMIDLPNPPTVPHGPKPRKRLSVATTPPVDPPGPAQTGAATKPTGATKKSAPPQRPSARRPGTNGRATSQGAKRTLESN
jgi:hypothetical protein